MGNNRSRKIAGLLLTIFALAGASISGPPGAATTTTLPDGTSLEVTITSPLEGTHYTVPLGGATDLTLEGTASVGAVDQVQATLIYVTDLSGSAGAFAGGDCGGDVAQDGHFNTILDCEAAAVIALNAEAIASGTIGQVGFVGYGERAAAAYVRPVAPHGSLTAPDADLNGNVMNDIEEIARTLRLGTILKFTPLDVGQARTNFEAGLTTTRDLLTSTEPHDRIIVAFLSDGISNGGSATMFHQSLGALDDMGAVVHTFAISPRSSCANGNVGTLQQIADATGGTCTKVVDPSDLPDILPELLSSSLDAIEVGPAGGPAVPLSASEVSTALPAPGAVTTSWTKEMTALGPGAHTLCATAHGTDSGGSGNATDCVTVTITFTVGLDVRPGSCENPFNTKARGVLPVAVQGTEGLDLGEIDPGTLRLMGVAPLRSAHEDASHEDDCTTNADGRADLVLHFPNRAIADAIGPVSRDDIVALTLTGSLSDGTPFEGKDTVRIVK